MVYHVYPHINGNIIRPTPSQTHPIYNPAVGAMIGEVIFCDKQGCEDAVNAAMKAFDAWSQTPPVKRARILFKLRDLLEKHQQELASIVSLEHGKTLEDAKGSVARGIEIVEYHCSLLSQLQGQISMNVASAVDCHTHREPLGVCAGVSPFNFPVMVPLWMMVPAIACGNTFILKPSEQDPSASVRLVELFYEAGLPAGVLNCIHGGKEVVEHLLMHPNISAFTAVASTPVAKAIYQTAILQGKRAHTFGGAKNHCVVLADADMKQAAQAIVGAAFGSAGERCMAISVVVAVGDETAEDLLTQLIPLIKAIRIDSGDKTDCDMGPLISQAHRQRVKAAIDQGIEEGASLLIDGRAFQHPKHPQGFFLAPSFFDHVNESMTIYQEEIFGPVLVMLRLPTLDEAIALVNRHQYGNGTAIFTRDGYSAREYSHRVHVGMVGVNIPIPVPIASHPFGGWKHSSFGDTSMHGMESIHFYTRLKTITTKWLSHAVHGNHFAMPTHD